MISSVSQSSDFQYPSQGLLTACFAPVAIYVLVYGQGIHFAYLFGFVILTRVISNIDLLTHVKPSTVSGLTLANNHNQMTGNRRLRRVNPARGDLGKLGSASRMVSSHKGGFQNPRTGQITMHVVVPPATMIHSSDCPRMKARRGMVNKISPDKLDSLTEKLKETFNVYSNREVLLRDCYEFLGLVFAAASRQPQYVAVFIELIQRICSHIMDAETTEDLLVNQCQVHWSTICLSPVEKTKGWESLPLDDRADATARHRSKQLALAEFCGLLASRRLIPASYPLSWLEALLKPIQASVESKVIANPASLESAVEMVCCTVRGLGTSESEGTFTDIDHKRFSALCDALSDIPITSSRLKCFLQDLVDLRRSGWLNFPDWKQALIPGKRTSSSG